MSREILVTVKQMQEIDQLAIKEYGVPSICLMENAGRAVAHEILKCLKGRKNSKVCIFCGLGNNAGDGFVVARHLINASVKVKVFLSGKSEKLKNDALLNYQILKKCKYPIKSIRRIDKKVAHDIRKCDLLVDAIFGTGLSREVQDPFKSVIGLLNASKKRIISVDIPSGLNGTTGEIHGVCIKAFKTVTFAYAKRGFFKNQGPKVTGKVIVVDIGIPKKILKEI